MSWCGGETVIEGRNPIIDVQNIIEEWAWNKFTDKMGSFRRLFTRREDYDVDVPMNYYQFVEKPPKYGDVDENSDQRGQPDNDHGKNTQVKSVGNSKEDQRSNGNASKDEPSKVSERTKRSVRQAEKGQPNGEPRPVDTGTSRSTTTAKRGINPKPDLIKAAEESTEPMTRIQDVGEDPTLALKQKKKPNSMIREIEDLNPDVSILSTVYKNDTNLEQTYQFRIERTRKAAVNISFQRGFSVGGSAKLKLALFEAEVNTKFEVTKTTGETFEQTLTFETNSDIKVEKNSNCIAKVYFSEKPLKKKFTVKTIMTMPSRSAPVFIKRKKDKKLFALFVIPDLAYVFDPYERNGEVEYVEEIFDDPDAPGGKAKTHNVAFTTTGILEGMRLAGQTVELQTVDLLNDPVSKSLNEGLEQHNARF